MFTVSGGVSGTGNLILDNNSAIAGGIMFSGVTVNNVGTITNSGNGSGSTSIGSVVGANVTGVTQNSASSTLILGGANLYTSGTTIDAGALLASNTTGSAVGTGSVTIQTGGILGGSGIVGTTASPVAVSTVSSGATSATNGHIAPGYGLTGTSVATLTINGSLTLDTDSFLDYRLGATTTIGGASNDFASVSGALTLQSSGTLNVTQVVAGGGLTTGNYTLITAGSILSPPSFSGWTIDVSNDAYAAAHTYGLSVVGNSLDLTIGATGITWTGVPSGGGTLNNTGTASQWDTTSYNWANSSNAAVQFSSVQGVVFADTYTVSGGNTGGTPSSTVNIQSGGVQPVLVSFTNASTSYVFSNVGSDVSATSGISGSASVVISGGGTVTFNGQNTYTGGTTLNAGTLNINNAGTTSTSSAIGSGMLAISGGSIDNTSGGPIALASNNPVTLAGSFGFGGTNDLNLGTGAVSLAAASPTITLGGTSSTLTFGGVLSNNVAGVATLTVNGTGDTLVLGGFVLENNGTTARQDVIGGSGNVTISGAITNGSGTGSGLAYVGTGTLRLTAGASTYTGLTSLGRGGTMMIGGTASLSGIDGFIDNSTLIISSSAATVLNLSTTGTNFYVGGNGSSGGTGSMYVGPGVTGTIELTSGNNFTVGNGAGGAATGTVFQENGSVISATTGTANTSGFYISANGGTGTYNISGGSLSVPTANFFIAGNAANTTGTLNINGGTVTAVHAFTIGNTNGNTGPDSATINLNAGTLQTPGWTLSTGTGVTSTLNFNGGTLQANAASTAFLGTGTGAGTTVNIFADGATIDTQANDITIAANLGNAPNSALAVSVTTPDSSTVFATPPALSFTGGSGSGAAGYATLDANGYINGIVLTNAGSYTSAPTVSVAGSSEALGTSLVANSGGGLTKLGSGMLTLSGADTYAGGTTVAAGTLTLSGAGTFGNGGLLTVSGGTADLAGISLTGSASVGGSSDGGSSNGTITSSSGTPTLTVNIAGSGNQSYSGTLAGSLTLAIGGSGAGTQILSGANIYSGGTNVNAGTLLANGSATATSSSTGTGSVTVNAGGSLGGSGSVLPTGSAGNVSILDGGTILGAPGQTLTINGTLMLSANASSSSSIATLTLGSAGDPALISAGSLNAPGIGTARVDITNSALLGVGTYDLSGYSVGPGSANPAVNFGFTNGVTFAVGDTGTLVTTGSQLDLVITAPLTWTGANSSTWDTTTQNWATATPIGTMYADGATVAFADKSPLNGMLVPNSGNPNYLATVTLPGAVSPGSITFTNTGAAHGGVDYLITGGGSINGSTGVTLAGSGGVGGNVYLATANTFSESVAVNAGQLILENPAALGATPTVTVASNAALGLQSGSGNTGSYGLTFAGSNPISTTLSGAGPSGNGALVSINGINTYAGAISIANSGATIGSLSSASGDGLAITGGIAGTATIGVTQTLAFVGAGNTTVSSAIADGTGGGKLGLTMNGSGTTGTLTLTAANTYTGPTQINSGTLRVAATGSLSASSAVTVGGTFASNSPTLSGGGTIGGPVEVSGTGTAGILSPSGFTGSSATTMKLTGNLTLDSGAVLSFNLSSAPDGTGTPNMLNDNIAVGGTFSLANSGTLNINATGGINTGTYQLIDYPLDSFVGTISSNLSGWSVVGGNQPQYSYTFSTAMNGQFDLIVGSSISSGSSTWVSNGNNGSTLYGLAANWSPELVPDNTTGNYYTATFGGTSDGTQGNVMLADSGGNPANFTVGGLIFASSSTPYTIGYQGTGSLTLDNGGTNGGPRVEVDSGAIQPFISANLILADSVSKSTMFSIVGGSTLVVNGPISESMTYPGQSITLTGGGTLELDGDNSYSGGTTVNSGILNVALGQDANNVHDGNLGTGPLTINDAGSTVNLYNSISIGDLSGTVGGTLNVNVGTLTVNQSNSTMFAGTLSLAGSTNLTVTSSNNSTLTIAGAPTFSGSNMLNVNSGTLAFNVTSGTPTVGTGVTVAVASGATLQLAGSVSALSAGGTSAAVNNSGTLKVTGTNQTVGVVSGVASVSGPTTYDGDTVVGDGMNAANLTATQILQNSLTINAGSTVTIAPAGDPPAAIPDTPGAVAGSSAATPARSVSEGDSGASGSSDSDPITAIQSAIASGAISSTTGQVLENRIAAIERLAAVDPGLDASLLESRVLTALPSAAADSSPIVDTGSSLLALDSSALGSGSASAGSTVFAPSASFAGSPAAVPEPSTLVLAALACIGLLLAARRRSVCRESAGPRFA